MSESFSDWQEQIAQERARQIEAHEAMLAELKNVQEHRARVEAMDQRRAEEAAKWREETRTLIAEETNILREIRDALLAKVKP